LVVFSAFGLSLGEPPPTVAREGYSNPAALDCPAPDAPLQRRLPVGLRQNFRRAMHTRFIAPLLH